ncbi:MAG: hypothetical protein IKW35_09265 [Paludibacteraceae bacterium]|nr:hypothetical protein [Paludibacteraceae bacterium]
MKKCFQVLFNKPLEFEDGVIYGFRIPCDELAKYIVDFAVEEIIGKWCFLNRHSGMIDELTKSKWIDRNGRIYYSGDATELYSYIAALDTHTYFRIDEYWVEDDYDLRGAYITDSKEYFYLRCLMEDQDYKSGYNGWLQVYQKLFSRYQRLLGVADARHDILDYEEQEKAKLDVENQYK